MKNPALWDHSRHFLNLRPVYALARWTLENLPPGLTYGFMRSFVEIAYRLSPRFRSGLEANLRHVLRHRQPGIEADELEREVRELGHRIFVNRGIFFADQSLVAGGRTLESVVRFIPEGRWEPLRAQLATGRGAIIASPHLGNWPLGSVYLGRTGVPVRNVLYYNHGAQEMESGVARRGKVKQTFIGTDPFSMLEVVEALRRGELVAMAADKPWDSRSVEARFFGKQCRFPLGPVRVARLAGAPIFPAFCVWERPREFRVILRDPIEVGGGDPEAAERAAVQELARVFEETIAAHLPVWFNFTPAWEGA